MAAGKISWLRNWKPKILAIKVEAFRFLCMKSLSALYLSFIFSFINTPPSLLKTSAPPLFLLLRPLAAWLKISPFVLTERLKASPFFLTGLIYAFLRSTEMVLEEHRFFYGGGEATRESLKKVKPDKAPHRGLGIAELEKLRREELQKGFSPGELVFHPFNPQPNTTVPFLPLFDPSFPFGYNVENFPMFRSQPLDSSPLVSSDGTMPLLWNSFQRDNSSSSSSQLSLATSELKQPSWELQPLFILKKHEPHQQISQVVNHSSLHSVPGADLQMELELPSNQSYYGIMNPSSWADQPLMMHQIVAVNHPWPFQTEAAQNQRVSVPEPIPISHPDCGTMMINGTQGTNTDCLIKHPTMKRNVASEEDIAAPIEGTALSLACLPSICSNGWYPKSISIRQFSEMNPAKRQKMTKESAGSKAFATPSDDLVFYNFMELPCIDYVAERDVIANQKKRKWEGSDAVDVDLKL